MERAHCSPILPNQPQESCVCSPARSPQNWIHRIQHGSHFVRQLQPASNALREARLSYTRTKLISRNQFLHGFRGGFWEKPLRFCPTFFALHLITTQVNSPGFAWDSCLSLQILFASRQLNRRLSSNLSLRLLIKRRSTLSWHYQYSTQSFLQ